MAGAGAGAKTAASAAKTAASAASSSGFWGYWNTFVKHVVTVLEVVGLAKRLRSGQVELNAKWIAVPIIYLLTFVMHAALPCFTINGYCVDQTTKKPLEYRINGILVLIAVLQVYVLYAMKNANGTIFYNEYDTCALSAFIMGLFFSFVAYFWGGEEKYSRCMTVDHVKEQQEPPLDDRQDGALAKFWKGRLWNPRLYDVDWKMLLYLIGAVMLELNILTALRAHLLLHHYRILKGMACYCAMMTWFVVDYLIGEAVHIYTYDIFAEKIGFKLIWGCLFFYPFFYPIGMFPLVKTPSSDDMSFDQCIACGVLFFIGWIITRGANMQKYFFRRDPESTKCFFGLIQQRTIPETKLLCSGFWGASRHLNYCGEIIQAIALAIPGHLAARNYDKPIILFDSLITLPPVAMKIIPWLYPLYYFALFIPRERDDDKLCAAKYGENWAKYKEQVPSRIFPGIY